MSTLTAGKPRVSDSSNTFDEPGVRSPLVLNHDSFASVTEDICKVNEAPKPPLAWYITFAISAVLALMLFVLVGYLFLTGVGVWGNNVPAAWGFPIVNFVFWVGIGHAGTLMGSICAHP